MLAIYMQGAGVLVTFDSNMVEDHGAHIPNVNPGIILVGHSPAIPYTVTATSASKIMTAFKGHLPDWHELSWQNSVAKITDATIEVGHMAAQQFHIDLSADFANTPGWQESLRACLLINSAA